RQIEYLNKFENHHLASLKSYFEALQKARFLKDLMWPPINPDSWAAELSRSREKLQGNLGAHVGLLVTSEKPEGAFDYFGQFVHTIGEALFDAILGNRPKAITPLIAPYFAGSFQLFEKLKPTNVNLDIWTQRQVLVAAAPILDLMSLSGY